MRKKTLTANVIWCIILCMVGSIISSCDRKQRDSMSLQLMSDDTARKELQQAAESINESCPLKADEKTQMEGASFTGNKWTYYYTVYEDTLVRFDNEVFNEGIKASLKESTRKHILATPDMQTMIKALIKVKADLVYQYRGSTSGKNIDVVFTYPELRVITDVMSKN